MKRFLGLAIVFGTLCISNAQGAERRPTSAPLILSAIPDLHSGSLVITGRDLHGYVRSAGARDPAPRVPTVTLGGLVLPIDSFTESRIRARFPAVPLASGTYLLTVAHARDADGYASFPVALGALGASAAADSFETPDQDLGTPVIGGGGGGGLGESIEEVLERIEGKIDGLVDARAGTLIRELCIELPFDLHLAVDFGWDAKIKALGTLGARALGSGAEGQGVIEGLHEFRVGVGGGAGLSWTMCRDVTRDTDNPLPEGPDDLFAAVTETLINLGIFDRATGDVDEAKILSALEAIRTFDPQLGPSNLLTGQENLFADLTPLLPVPEPFRAKVEDLQSAVDATLSEVVGALDTLCDTAGDYPASMSTFLLDMCARIPSLTVEEIEMAFNELLGLRSDIEMAFDVCLNSSQDSFSIPAIFSPEIDSHSIFVGFPIDMTFVTFPGFSARQIYGGNSVEVIDVQEFVACLGEQLP